MLPWTVFIINHYNVILTEYTTNFRLLFQLLLFHFYLNNEKCPRHLNLRCCFRHCYTGKIIHFESTNYLNDVKGLFIHLCIFSH